MRFILPTQPFIDRSDSLCLYYYLDCLSLVRYLSLVDYLSLGDYPLVLPQFQKKTDPALSASRNGYYNNTSWFVKSRSSSFCFYYDLSFLYPLGPSAEPKTFTSFSYIFKYFKYPRIGTFVVLSLLALPYLFFGATPRRRVSPDNVVFSRLVINIKWGMSGTFIIIIG